jgi:hypothetical protein
MLISYYDFPSTLKMERSSFETPFYFWLRDVISVPTFRNEDGIFVVENEDQLLTKYGILLKPIKVSDLLRTQTIIIVYMVKQTGYLRTVVPLQRFSFPSPNQR